MFRTAVSVLCAIAVLTPTAAFAGDWHNRGRYDQGNYNRPSYGRVDYGRPRVIYPPHARQRVRTIDFSIGNRDFDRRDGRYWERREAERARARYWRDRRDDRYRRDYDRDRYNRPSIIIIPRISF